VDAKEDAAGAYAKVWHARANAFWTGISSPVLFLYLRAKAEEQGNSAAARDHYKQFLRYWRGGGRRHPDSGSG
jgi:hypothetical protein